MKYKALYDIVSIRHLPYIAVYVTPSKTCWFSCREGISEVFMDFKKNIYIYLANTCIGLRCKFLTLPQVSCAILEKLGK